jgi:hypothetical protein
LSQKVLKSSPRARLYYQEITACFNAVQDFEKSNVDDFVDLLILAVFPEANSPSHPDRDEVSESPRRVCGTYAIIHLAALRPNSPQHDHKALVPGQKKIIVGISLTYRSSEPVSPFVAQEVERQSIQLQDAFDWWCEPIQFYARREDGHISGFSKIMLGDYSTATGEVVVVDPDDDSFMAWRDTVYIIEQLGRWSATFNITWHLDLYGDDLGTITPSGPSLNLKEHLSSLKRRVQPANEDEMYSVSRAQSISRRYASRNG